MAVREKVKLGAAYFGVVLTVVTVLQFVKFLSFLPADSATPTAEFKQDQSSDSWATVRKTAWVLLQDISYLCAFFFLHSILADASVKDIYVKYGIQDLERSIYVIVSCVTLQIMIQAWQPVPWFMLWNFNIGSNKWLWWPYIACHGYIWVLMYTGNLMLDISELLGIKQVEYSYRGLPSPDKYKSKSLKQLRKHMYHTSFLGFSLLFWIYPCMRLDRALMAVLLQIYMGVKWATSAEDVAYLKEQFEDKAQMLTK